MKLVNRSFRSSRASRARALGFSIIELMISMAIGLVVVLTVLAAYLGSGVSGRHSSALGQISEDATLALNILRAQIAMAGYSQPYGVNTATGLLNKPYSGVAVFGCDTTFDNVSAAVGSSACTSPAVVTTDSIVMAYQADASNAILTSSNVPTDCAGNALPQVAAVSPAPAYYLSANRYYLSTTGSGATAVTELYCKGNGAASTAAIPLVQNIVDLQLTYGVGTSAAPRQVSRYVSASTLGVIGNWGNVVAVRACIVVRSAQPVMDAATAYQGCAGSSVTPTDRYMYRAFTTTVVLYNRAGVN